MFEAVTLTSSIDQDKDFYLGYSIEFDSRSFFSLSNFDWDENVNIFGVDSSSSVRIDNKKGHLSSWWRSKSTC